MNRFETAQMLSYVSEIDGRRVTDEAVNVWMDLLGSFEFEEVRQAVIRHSTESTEFLKPAHVVKLVKTARRERLKQVTNEIRVSNADDRRGPDAPAEIFAEFRRVRGEVSNAIATGLMGTASYQEYANGTVPWDDFKQGLDRRRLEQ